MSKQAKAIAIVLLTSAVALGLVWSQHAAHGSRGRAAAPATRDDAQEDLRSLKDKIARLEETSALQGAVLNRRLAETNTAAPADPPASSAASKDDTAAPPGEHLPSEAEALAQLDDKFDAQPRDPAWSGPATTQATRALSSDLPPGSTLGGIECRTDLCRVESTHTNLDAFKTYVQAALLSREKKLWNAGFSAQVIAQGPSGVKAVTYITKEGHPVPPAEPVPD